MIRFTFFFFFLRLELTRNCCELPFAKVRRFVSAVNLPTVILPCSFDILSRLQREHIFLYDELCQHCRHNLNAVGLKVNRNYAGYMRHLGCGTFFVIIYNIDCDLPELRSFISVRIEYYTYHDAVEQIISRFYSGAAFPPRRRCRLRRHVPTDDGGVYSLL